MKESVVVRVDNKGRITLPLKMRQEFHIETGDVFFVIPEKPGFYLAKAENPFDILAKHALEESRGGRTIPLENFIKDHFKKVRKNTPAKRAKKA